MWHKPQLLNAIADLLFIAGAAALLAVAAVWMVRMPSVPVRQVVFTDELSHVRRAEIEQVLPAALVGNFFSMNLDSVRAALETLPWVRRVDVRRVWPAKLEVRVEEHEPVARWQETRTGTNGELVNSHGEVFAAQLETDKAHRLPILHGPQGTASDVLKRFNELRDGLKALGSQPVQLALSPRLAWQVRLDNDLIIDMGREQPKSPVDTRLSRFVQVYPDAVMKRALHPSVVDLRYPNGFALRLAAESKGK